MLSITKGRKGPKVTRRQLLSRQIIALLGLVALFTSYLLSSSTALFALDTSKAAVLRGYDRSNKLIITEGADTETPTTTATATATGTPTPDCTLVWQQVTSANPFGTNHLLAVHVVAGNDIWAVGAAYSSGAYRPLAEHWNGNTWTAVTMPRGSAYNNEIWAIGGIAANDLWAVGTYLPFNNAQRPLIEHWNGNQWAVASSPDPGAQPAELRSVVAIAANDVWAVGYNNNAPSTALIEHWDGAQWSIVSSPSVGAGASLYGVTALSADDIWAVGTYHNAGGPWQTLIEHWDGVQWSIVSSPSPRTYENWLYGVSAVSNDDVWAVGYARNDSIEPYPTLVMHWDGDAWSVVDSPTPPRGGPLLSVAAIASNDVWAVGGFDFNGNTGLIEHWDGSEWSVVSGAEIPGATGLILYGVAALSQNEVWAVGTYSSGLQSLTLVERYGNPCPSPTPTGTLPTSTVTLTPLPTFTPTLTAAATSTATSTPTTEALLVGHVTWQGRPAQPNVAQVLPISLTLRLASGGTGFEFSNGTTDASGFFTMSVSSLTPGVYNWRAKNTQVGPTPPEQNPGWLAASGVLTLTGAPLTSQEVGLLRSGDCDNNNVVNSTDFIILKNSFGRSLGQTAYDNRADLTGDGVVSGADFVWFRSNFGLGGAPPISPFKTIRR